MNLIFEKQMDEQEASMMNALQLAYLGDTIWELIIRYDLVLQGFNLRHMHRDCVKMVNAHSQSVILAAMQAILSEQEKEIVRRGRNAHAKHPVPKNQNPEDYALSTGFEALFGFLALTGQNERIDELIQYVKEVNTDA